MNEDFQRLLVIVAEKTLTECDNVGGPPRKECQCDACEGYRLMEKLRLPDRRPLAKP